MTRRSQHRFENEVAAILHPERTPSYAEGLRIRIAVFVLAVGLVHMPFWILSPVMAMERAIFSVELIIAVSILAWQPPLGVCMLIIGWALDLIVSQTFTFHFLSPLAFLKSGRFATEVDWTRLLSWQTIALGAMFAGALIACIRLVRSRKRAEWRFALIAIVLILALDAFNGTSLLSRQDQRVVPVNLGGSPAITLVRQSFASSERQPLKSVDPDSSLIGKADLESWVKAHPNGGIWFVVVESMGWPIDDRLYAEMAEPMVALSRDGNYRLQSLRLPFSGATTAGELRSLCGLSGSYTDLTVEVGAACLPAKLASLGWTTHGLHGFSGHMFDRFLWWPRMGLQRVDFREQLSADNPSCGGAFRGICDNALLARGAERLSQPRQFVYVLTLNTHLPLDRVEVPTDWQRMCESIRVSQSVCELTLKQRQLLQDLADKASQLPEPRPLLAVIGDHSPPFVELNSRHAFHEGVVPAFVLTPLPPTGQ